MSKAGATLAARILAELNELSQLAARAEQGWERAKKKNDDYYLDGVALNIHGFYSGLELIFEKIASGIDGSVPTGANWHRELLDQMSLEVSGIRPAVISDGLKEELEAYRGFRHVVRNVYTHRLSEDKMRSLVEKLRTVYIGIEKELTVFAGFLKEVPE